jgi:hypothetical protein
VFDILVRRPLQSAKTVTYSKLADRTININTEKLVKIACPHALILRCDRTTISARTISSHEAMTNQINVNNANPTHPLVL